MPDERDQSYKPENAIPESGPLMSSGVGIRMGRMDNGDVLVICDAESIVDTRWFVIPADTWGSLIAHVSARGEQPGEWHKATAWHQEADFIDGLRRILALCCNLADTYEVQLTANERQLLDKYYILFEMPRKDAEKD